MLMAFVMGCASRPASSYRLMKPVALHTREGVSLLRESESLQGLARLIGSYETQSTQTFCGVASSVIALNASGVAAPEVERWKPYRAFTQEAFFVGNTEEILPETKVRANGMTLDELGRVLESKGATVEVMHADRSDLMTFRRVAREVLRSDAGVVLVNYHRPSVSQPGGGHISPIAAYSSPGDAFLVLDVARYRLSPVWIDASTLWSAMSAVDSDSQRSRGFVVVSVSSGATTHAALILRSGPPNRSAEVEGPTP